jgi:hypothetical protein
MYESVAMLSGAPLFMVHVFVAHPPQLALRFSSEVHFPGAAGVGAGF